MSEELGIGRAVKAAVFEAAHDGSTPSSPARITGRSSPRGYFGVGLLTPKTEVNVGAALRACGVYGASFMAISGKRFKRCATDTMKAYRHLPVIEVEDLRGAIPFDCVPVAVELVDGARSIVNYSHPERAFYLFGPEDSSLGRRTLDWCRDVIYVPTEGCMNLAACVNVVLYDRLAKSLRRVSA